MSRPSPPAQHSTFSSSHRKRVVTTPTWARGLPPEFDDDDDIENDNDEPDKYYNEHIRSQSPNSTSRTTSNSNKRRRSLSSVLASNSSNRATSPPPLPLPTRPNLNSQNTSSSTTTSSSIHQSPPPTSPTAQTQTQPQPIPIPSQASSTARPNSSSNSAQDNRWWTFTLPSKYLDKVQEYVQTHGPLYNNNNDESQDNTDGATTANPVKGKERSSSEPTPGTTTGATGAATGTGTGNGEGWINTLRWNSRNNNKDSSADDEEKALDGLGFNEKQEGAAAADQRRKERYMSMQASLPPPNIFSMNQTQAPGWSSPWQPFQREGALLGDPFNFSTSPTSPTPQTRSQKLENFILNSVYAPIVFRFLNVVLVSCTLALACHIRVQETRAGIVGVLGSSTIMVIVISPLAIVHVFVNVYIEYFGRPIGLWQIKTKMFHTLTELIFISLFSSTLSLCFDDLFTSSLECTSWTPYKQFVVPPLSQAGSSQVEGTLADQLCNQQVALVVFVFSSVGLYLAVLVISLFRIFARVRSR
ncbi:hypothetical protein T439DRAFT_318905 [Meredithblackwellia eburnea MCA 4105]